MKKLPNAEFSDYGNSVTSETSRSATFSDPISCCSKYRECSAAMKCLNANKSISDRCSYRQKIESGVSFYGKNTVGFDTDECARYKAAIFALSPEAYDCYIRLLKLFWVTRRCSPREVLYKCSLFTELEKAGLIVLSAAHDHVLSKYKDKPLRALISNNSWLQLQWKETEAQLKQDAAAKDEKINFKKSFIPWLKATAPEIIPSLDETYCFVSIPILHKRFAEEYYIDTIGYAQNDIPDFVFPLETESVFLGVVDRSASND